MSIQTRVRFYLFAVMMIGLSLPIQDVRSDAMPATTPYSDSKNIPDNSEYPLPDQAVIVVGRETEVVNQVENQLSKLGVPTSQDIKIQIKSQTISQGASQAISQSTSQFKNDSNSKIVSLGELTCWSESAKKPQPTSTVNPRQETATANAKPEFLKITESPDLKLVIYFKKLDAKMQTEVVDKIAETLNRLAVEKGITRVHITGHTDSDVITGNGLKKFKDNYELSDYRAKTIANILRRNFKSSQMSYEGKGPDQPLASNDDENGKAKNRRTEVWVYYKNVEKIKSTSVTTSGMSGDSRQPESSSTAINELNSNSKQNPFRVTLDGQPFNFPGYQETAPAQHVDFQRCTDVALEKSAVQIKFDPLHADKRLNLTPDRLIGSIHQAIRFRAYSNYLNFIDHAELRVFLKEQSTRLTPYDVMTFTRQGINFEDIYWQPKLKDLEQEYQFVLRVVDAQGFYDETQPLTLKYSLRSDYNTEAGESYLNAGYGENHLAQSKIKVQGGTIRVFGEQIPSTHTLSVMGQSIPRDSEGDFITEQILDSGKNYGIDVAIKNPEGKGLEFRRDLYLPQNNWFFVGISDLIVGGNQSKGPISLVTQDTYHYDRKVYLDGRIAFYLKGKIKGSTLITASADTREGPVKDIFRNFLDKNPQEFLRRLDPDRFYPVYGDDSTLIEDAPTSGKFYVKVENDKNYILWGNSRTRIEEPELSRVDRAIYGGAAHVEILNPSRQGLKVDAFAATPGTVPSYEEFRGNGTSEYWLQHQDISTGSEKIRLEIRDRNTGWVLQSKVLRPFEDYTFNPIQGHLFFNQVVPSLSNSTLFSNAPGTLGGHPVYLVVTYEYTPGFNDPQSRAYGGRISQSIGEHLQVGINGAQQKDYQTKHAVVGADVQLNLGSSYLKAEAAQTTGQGFSERFSLDSGYQFQSQQAPAISKSWAHAYQAEGHFGLFTTSQGQAYFNLFGRKKDKGFSNLGQVTLYETTQYGADTEIPLFSFLSYKANASYKEEKTYLKYWNYENDLKFIFSDRVNLEGGIRVDRYEDLSSGANPILTQQELGEKADLAAKLSWLLSERWDVSLLGQKTLARDSTRRLNNRLGLGLGYQLNSKLKVNLETTGGSGGFAGKLGGDYKLSDRSQVYINALSQNQRTDSGYRAQSGNLNSLTSGTKYRFSDSDSIYYENRYVGGDQPSGLTHTFGVDLVPLDQWNLGFSVEHGRLVNQTVNTGLTRTAGSLSLGYGNKKTKWASAFEMRIDQNDTTVGQTLTRRTFITKNQITQQVSDPLRVLAKLNLSRSVDPQNSTYNGDWTDGVIGFGYRPTHWDRMNTLFQYRYFTVLPASGQVDLSGNMLEYQQKTHLLSADLIYQINRYFSAGLKFAYAIQNIRGDRIGQAAWLRNDRELAVLRLDYHVIYDWDLVGELRTLRLPKFNDSRSGFLLGVYKNLLDDATLKLGVGYNFTNFSSDLTDLTYRNRGWFINLVGGL